MPHDLWTSVDHYITGHLLPPDPALEGALQRSVAAGLPQIQVSPPQGKFLHLLALGIGARRILEVGTLGGYSAIWLARALPSDGRLVTLELEPKHAAVARENLEHAGVLERVDLRVGRALDILPLLEAGGIAPFDLFFLDADKPSNADYVQWALRLARPGSLIVVDNVVRAGRVADPDDEDANVRGVRRLFEMLSREPRLQSTAIQTVGEKGHDGWVISRVA